MAALVFGMWDALLLFLVWWGCGHYGNEAVQQYKVISVRSQCGGNVWLLGGRGQGLPRSLHMHECVLPGACAAVHGQRQHPVPR